jgi:hypothetical protein
MFGVVHAANHLSAFPSMFFVFCNFTHELSAQLTQKKRQGRVWGSTGAFEMTPEVSTANGRRRVRGWGAEELGHGAVRPSPQPEKRRVRSASEKKKPQRDGQGSAGRSANDSCGL